MITKPVYCSTSEEEFHLFREYIKNSCGICIPPEKAYLIETRLSKLMIDAGAENFSEFFKIITTKINYPLHQQIINAITTNETLWFRDESPWKYLEEELLPKMVEDIATGKKKKVRIWSAASSTGKEIYSTVMCIDNYLQIHKPMGVRLSDFEFFATDISMHVLETGKTGRYDSISITRGLSDYYKSKYFTQNNSAWDIDPKIRDAVNFRHFNLQNSYQRFGLFDIIFCRYVLIYFTDDLKKEIIKKMHGALTDGGILFTGNYALYNMFEDYFNVDHFENTTYYSKKAVRE